MYGTERSFRVPRLMADFGYANPARFSDEAVDAFAKHFPEGVTPPTWEQMKPLWNQWLSTEEAKQIDLSPYISSESFDDGMGYHITHIPDEFYTWMINREIVIDPMDGLFEVSTYNNSQTLLTEPSVPTLCNPMD